jgi:hypothetical protein
MRRLFNFPDEMQVVVDNFPHRIGWDGFCEKRVNGLCSVYENRPWVCNTEETRKRFKPDMSQNEHDQLTAKGCMIIGGRPSNG